MTIALDIEVTDALRAEGVARELVNRIQNLRKEAGLDVTDKIHVGIYAEGADYDEIHASLVSYREYLASQTLARKVVLGRTADAPASAADVEWNEALIKIEVNKTL